MGEGERRRGGEGESSESSSQYKECWQSTSTVDESKLAEGGEEGEGERGGEGEEREGEGEEGETEGEGEGGNGDSVDGATGQSTIAKLVDILSLMTYIAQLYI